MRPMVVISNADAGGSDREALEAGLAVLREYGEVTSIQTSSAEELAAALTGVDGAGEVADGGDQTEPAEPAGRWVVVAGGDGSLHAVIQTLHSAGTLATQTIGLLPMGTGNDFARGVGIPLEVERAAHLIGQGQPRPVDLIVDSHDDVVVNNVHIGAGAQASRRGARWKHRLARFGLGKAGYPVGAAISALDSGAVTVSVFLDGEPVTRGRDRILMAAVGIGPSVGGGTELTPNARVGDAALDLMVSFATGGWARLGYVLDLVRRRHQRRDDVVMLRGSRVQVHAAEGSDGFWASADGEISGPHRDIEWRLIASAYSMVLPAQSSNQR